MVALCNRSPHPTIPSQLQPLNNSPSKKKGEAVENKRKPQGSTEGSTEARAAMTASLDLWTWPSDGRDSQGNPGGVHGLHETMFDPVARGGLYATGSAGGDDNDDIEILGESRARSDSPCDEAIPTMKEADVPSSHPVRGEPEVGGGIGVGAWGLQASGHGMALDSVTDMAGAGAGARLGVRGLGSGQVRLGEGVDRAVLSAQDGVSAQPSADCVEAVDVVSDIDQAPGLANL
jgi:hypothetical protein